MKELKRVGCYTTKWVRNKNYLIGVDEESLIMTLFRKKVEVIIEATNLYQKYDSISFDFTKDERRK